MYLKPSDRCIVEKNLYICEVLSINTDQRTKQLKRWIAALLALSFAIMLCLPGIAVETPPRVLKVAFPQVKGFTQTAEDGTRYGMVVDYLNEIAKYTGWEYEYIDTNSETLIPDFLEGKYDLLGGTYYSPGFEEYFAYPKYNTGYSKAVLLARQEDRSILNNNLQSLDGKTIGVYERAVENVRRLKEFLSINNIDCTIKYYGYDKLTNGNLYAYLESGEVDLLLGNGVEGGERFRVAATFDSQPYYIVTKVGEKEILDGLNMALGKITDANPNYGAERYAAYFPDRLTASIQLTGEELNYIKQKKTITVAVVGNNWHPLFCMNSKDDGHNGIVPDILEEVAAYTGLDFSFLYADTYISAIHMVQDGKADILGFFLGTEEDAAEQNLALSAPYVNMNYIVIRNKASSYPAEGLTCAVVEGRKVPSDISASNVRNYPDIEAALSAVNRGEADIMYGLSARMERAIQRYQFTNLVPVTIVNDSDNLNFALPRPADPNLLTILNKALNSLSDDKKTEILNRNMISIGVENLSLKELIYANPFWFIFGLSLFLLILVAAILWINRTRTKAIIMKNNLERAEAESRAKGEFLSRMSHEIRTPMNAVMGLTDLTLMKKDIPADIRDNLQKVQSSSQYLRDLINDILDMSRIDSGMLSIAMEPFSMNYMLSEIQSMMGSEAQKHGLSYTIEKDIVHSGLIGDVIRLRQVLINLLSNAFKFTPAGGTVCLRVSETKSSDGRATFDFQVTDTGVGISEEDQKRIFGSFEQVGTNYSKSQGTGLGLSISSNIVQLMGGELKVKSELGRGSAFYFTITLALGEATAVSAETPERLTEGILDGVHILLAEDNDLNAEIAAQLLQAQGAAVVRCENGKRAAEQFESSEKNAFQAILMDIQMPEMNGYEAARVIREMNRPDAKTIPIIAMTANAFAEDIQASFDAGMNAHIAKPLDVDKLWSTLRAAIEEAAK